MTKNALGLGIDTTFDDTSVAILRGHQEILASGKFNNKFSMNLLENGAKNYMQGIYLGYMYSRWRKIRGLDKDDPIENKGQMQSSFKDFEKKIK